MFYDTSNNKSNFLRELYIELNKNKVITFISENCYSLLGYTKKELIGKPISDYISQIPENIISNINFKREIITRNGTLSSFDIVAAPITNDKNIIIGAKLSLMDISKYSKSENDAKRLIQMFERSKDFVYRLEVYPEFKFTYLSPSVKEILGYTVEEHINNPYIPLEIVQPKYKNYVLDKYKGNVDFSTPIPIKYKNKNGNYIWLEDYTVPIYNENGDFIAFEGVCRDITERKELEQKLELLSLYDGLTGLTNKLFIEREINNLNTKQDTSIGVFFCDLDNLKITNDTLGHEFGDKLIVYTSNILKDTFKQDAIISRTGGDEFIVLLKDTSLDKVKCLYSKLCYSIKQQNKYNKEIPISFSIGYSFSESSIGIIRQVISIADNNMYKDKQRKKNGIYKK